MLNVLTPEEVSELIKREFYKLDNNSETVPLDYAAGRILSEDITAAEYVPDFNRSTVDGYALRASDTFGCSESMPAILPLTGEVLMGHGADFVLPEGTCCYVPTGGAIPDGADCAVMIEYTEDYADGTIGILKPAAPGSNMIFRGDDVFPGKTVLKRGRRLNASDIGALAAIGTTEVPVVKKIRVGVISTGDELVPPEEKPGPGQIRDVNSASLKALIEEKGFSVINYGIIADDKARLKEATEKALFECDAVLLSGGSSVGIKDDACEIIESLGKMLLHGIAVKPGKPTILGKAGNKPIFGLPGHPVAAFFMARIFVLPVLEILAGFESEERAYKAVLSENIGANHGRAQLNAVKVSDGIAYPVRSKSGLITQLAGSDGFIIIPRDCEGLSEGTEVDIIL